MEKYSPKPTIILTGSKLEETLEYLNNLVEKIPHILDIKLFNEAWVKYEALVEMLPLHKRCEISRKLMHNLLVNQMEWRKKNELRNMGNSQEAGVSGDKENDK